MTFDKERNNFINEVLYEQKEGIYTMIIINSKFCICMHFS